MRYIILSMLVPWTAAIAVAGPPRTMRLDYYHTGNASQELFAVDKSLFEPLPWPGNMRQPVDELNLGRYLFELRDSATKQVLYTRGFDSIYGEWVTTAEAKTANRTFHESVRFPAPASAAQIVIKKRDARNDWRDTWTATVDPADKRVDTSTPESPGPLIEIEKNGTPETKVDLLLLGDGYTTEERTKFEADARRLVAALFATSPFKERRRDFNVWGLCPAARQSGISQPSLGIHRTPPLGSSYDVFGTERYVLTFDNRAFRNAAAFAPYDFVEILVNSKTYGGGGIFGQFGTAAAGSELAPYLFVHEFGHHFAGLADEYFTSSVAYLPPAGRVEPWEPNVTALLNPDRLRWKDLVEPGTPIPTPWQHDEFLRQSRDLQKRRAELRKEQRPESEINALFAEQKRIDDHRLASEKYAKKIGAFEGANYQPKGFYRSQVNCIMFSRTDFFCLVCRRAIERIIDQYTKP